jgi:aryl-alcohol dehydrogenase-like predicted oxidoreductase
MALVEIVSVQNLYNVATRQHEPVLKYCEREGLAFIPWFPLGGGDLISAEGPLAALAGRHGVTVPQLCLAWLLHHSAAIIPIPGTSSPEHLRENVGSADLVLSADEIEDIEDAGAQCP